MPVLVERWKSVPGWTNYEVSNIGRVRTYWTRKGARGKRGAMTTAAVPKLLKGQMASGRLIVTLGRGYSGSQKTFGVAYLVLWAFVRPPQDGEIARHYHDPNPLNCKVWNLRWGTSSDNSQDIVRHFGKHHNTGRKHTAEAKSKMSASRLGKKLSASHKAAVGASKLGRKLNPITRKYEYPK